MNTLEINRAQIYSCMPVSNSRLYDSDFLQSLAKLSEHHSPRSSKAKTEKSIEILEENMVSASRFRRSVFSNSYKSFKMSK
jgi:hypothetical protein